MAKSMVEKYEQILSADPGSMVFVELAKALIERGDHARAIETVKAGLEHHPGSIVGRVLWGKALLNLGQPGPAMEQFELATGLEKENPYAYNLIGEVLLHKKLYRSALPILKKAVQLQPGDGRVRQWLEQAQRALGGQPVMAEVRESTAVDAGAPPAPAPAPAPPPVADPFAAVAGPVDDPVGDPTRIDVKPLGMQYGEASGLVPVPPPAPEPTPDAPPVAEPQPAAPPPPAPDAEDPFAAAARRRPVEDEEVVPGLTSTFLTLAARADAEEKKAAELPAAAPAPAAAAPEPAPAPTPTPEPTPPPPVVAAPPPPAAPPRPPPMKGKPSALDLLGDIPDAPAPVAPPPPAPAVVRESTQQAAQIAAAYEQELRQRLYQQKQQPKSWARRHWIPLALVGVLLVAGAAAASVFAYSRAQTRDRDVADAIAKARNGLTRDTKAAVRAAADALEEALDRDEKNVSAKALRAQALAMLAGVWGTGEEDATAARALLEEPALRTAEPEAFFAARWALAGLTPEPAARRAIEDEILALPEAQLGPTLQGLAGAALAARGDAPKAAERFNAAIKAQPSHVPTLVRVGELHRGRGEFEDALRYYGLAVAVADDHPGALAGAAAARLASSRDPKSLADSLASLAPLADEAVVPVALRLPLALTKARLHAALGQRAEALAVLQPVDDALRARPELVAELADAYLAAGGLDRAEAALESATQARPDDLALRTQYAQVLIARQNFRGVTRLKAGPEDRVLHLVKGLAHYRLGELDKARVELNATATKDGKKPIDAVVYLALVDLASGDVEQARANLERLGTGPKARPTGRWAWATMLFGEGRRDEAEKLLRENLEAEPRHTDSRVLLGRLLAQRGQLEPAIAELTEAIAQSPAHREALVALGDALLGKGDVAGASQRFEAALALDPRDGGALGGRARVLLAQGKTPEARTEAEKAVQSAPQSPEPHRALAATLAAQGDPAGAARALGKALPLAAGDPGLGCELGELLLAAGDGRGALGAFDAVLAKSAELPRARLGRGRALVATKMAPIAERELRVLVAKVAGDRPLQARARAALSEALLAQGKPQAASAVKEAQQAVAVDGTVAAGHLSLGRALEATGDVAGAKAAYGKAVELAPADAEAQLARGFFLATRGKEETAAAVEALMRYLELAPKGPSAGAAKKVLGMLQARK